MPLAALATVSMRTALLAAALSGCAAYAPPAQGGGTIIYPPARGEAILSAVLEGEERDIVRATVAGDGTYSLILPSPPPYLGTPTALLVQGYPAVVEGAQCSGALTLTPGNARLLLLRAGRFAVGGQVAGRLSPATSAVTLQSTPPNIALTTRQFVYADRAASLITARTCTFTLGSGQTLSGRVQADLTLVRGWNTLLTRTEQTSAGVTVSLSAGTTLSGVDWQYLPGAP